VQQKKQTEKKTCQEKQRTETPRKREEKEIISAQLVLRQDAATNLSQQMVLATSSFFFVARTLRDLRAARFGLLWGVEVRSITRFLFLFLARVTDGALYRESL
jgi:hypothetical protein